MFQILKSSVIAYDDNGARKFVQIAVDAATDLPEAPSDWAVAIAWDISTGDFYGLDSTGQWINQTSQDSGTKTLSVGSPSLTKTILPDLSNEEREAEPTSENMEEVTNDVGTLRDIESE